MAGSFQDAVRRRQAAGFVARTDELARFRANLALPVDDPGRRFVFSVHGDGGVGKTFLSRRLRSIAEGHGAATGWVDERAFGAPEAMRALAADLDRAGEDMGGFEKLLGTYLKRRLEVEADPNAPAGTAAFITQTAVRVGLHAAHAVPGVGGVADSINPDTLAQQADQLRTFLGKKFRHHEDVRMLLSPLEALSPAFVECLVRIGRRKQLALFFDTFEQTGSFLDGWLRSVLDGAYGDLPPDLVVTIAGRHQLDLGDWSGYAAVLADVPLLPFTEAEGRQLLADKGVTDERVIQVILNVSGRLPLLVATLAENQPTDPSQVGDPSGDAVERFLKWETDAGRRSTAVAAALPRVVNEDILGVLTNGSVLEASERSRMFAWLRSLPFVSHDAGRCVYHEVVRTAMIRLERTRSPARWRDRHRVLAMAYRQWSADIPAGDRWDDTSWRDRKIEETYHLLCADPAAELSEALTEVVFALDQERTAAAQWAQMIRQAGDDAGSAAVSSWGQRLEESLRGGGDEATVACLTCLIRANEIAAGAMSVALRRRGRSLYFLDRDDEALADLDQAVALAPDDKYALVYRGDERRFLGRCGEALADFDRTLELEPNYARAMSGRGETYYQLSRYPEALSDLSRATELDPGDKRAFAFRGDTYRLMERYDDALADFNRAIELDPGYEWAIASRGQTFRAMGRHEEAITDFTRGIELDSGWIWAIAQRGETYRLMERYDDALADFNRAIELEPGYEWAIASRGETYRLMDRYDDALADFNRAIELDPEYGWAIAHRGAAYYQLSRYDEALSDLSHAMEIDHDPWVVPIRGITCREMRRYDEALTDLTRAIESDPAPDWALAERGETYRVMYRYEEALADFNRAIELDPGYGWAIASRGQTFQAMGRYEEALSDLGHALELDRDSTWPISIRGETRVLMGRYREALADFDRMIELHPGSARAVVKRGLTKSLMECHEDALTDFSRALELDPKDDWAVAGRGQTYRRMGRYQEARADISHAIQLDPEDDWYRYELALVHTCLGDHDQARTELLTAVERVSAELLTDGYYPQSPFNIAVYRAALGDYEKALDDVRRAIELFPNVRHIGEAVRDLRELSTIPSVDTGEIERIVQLLDEAATGASGGGSASVGEG